MKKLIRRLFVIFIAIVLIGGGVFGVALFNLSSLLNYLKPYLETKVGEILKADVHAEEISASIFPSSKIVLNQVRVKPLGATINEKGIEVGSVELSVRLPALLQKRVEVTQIQIRKPILHVIRDEKGVQIIGLPPSSEAAHDLESTREPTSNTSPDKKPLDTTGTTPTGQSLAFQIEKIALEEGTIYLQDFMLLEPITLSTLTFSSGALLVGDQATLTNTKMSLRIQGTQSTKEYGEVSFSAPKTTAFLAEKRAETPQFTFTINDNSINGSISSDAKTMAHQIAFQSDGITISKLLSFVPLVSPNPLPEVRGGIRVKGSATLPQGGTPTFQSDVTLVQVGTAVGKAQLENLSLTAHVAGGTDAVNVRVDEFPFFQGKVAGNGAFQVKTKSFNGDLRAGGLNLEALTKFANEFSGNPNGLSIKGTLSSFTVKTSGVAGTGLNGIQAEGDIAVSDTALEGVNILREIFLKLEQIPVIATRISDFLPPEFRNAFASSDTLLKSVTSHFQLRNGIATLRNFAARSEIFGIEGEGTTELATKRIDLQTRILFSDAFSRALVDRVKRLSLLLNDKGVLSFPLLLQGIPPKILVLPDFKKVLEGAGKQLIKEQAENLINKLVEKKAPGAGKVLEGLFGGFKK